MDEQQLIEGCKHKNPLAYKKLYELYAPTMIGVCARYVGNREIARDVLQDGFVKVFTKIHTYSGMGSFAGWIRRIFVTTALEHLRLNKKHIDIEEVEELLEEIDSTILQKLSADELFSCIVALPEGYRTVYLTFLQLRAIHIMILQKC